MSNEKQKENSYCCHLVYRIHKLKNYVHHHIDFMSSPSQRDLRMTHSLLYMNGCLSYSEYLQSLIIQLRKYPSFVYSNTIFRLRCIATAELLSAKQKCRYHQINFPLSTGIAIYTSLFRIQYDTSCSNQLVLTSGFQQK